MGGSWNQEECIFDHFEVGRLLCSCLYFCIHFKFLKIKNFQNKLTKRDLSFSLEYVRFLKPEIRLDLVTRYSLRSYTIWYCRLRTCLLWQGCIWYYFATLFISCPWALTPMGHKVSICTVKMIGSTVQVYNEVWIWHYMWNTWYSVQHMFTLNKWSCYHLCFI